MGRRALRKIPPTVRWEPYLLSLEQLAKPFNGPQVFGRPAPLMVEVGSGKGLFLEHASARRPDCNLLGVEIRYKYARYCAARLARQEATNARMIHGDALELLTHWIDKDSVAELHVYFPDPWWKSRHRRRRVLRPEFLERAERTLVPGGELHFWTDVQEYFESTLELIARTRLAGPFEVPQRAAEHDLDYQTHFERRTRLHDAPVYRAWFRKPAAS